MNRRSILFMPGNNPGMLQDADVLGADTIIFDLEDAVVLDEKDSARSLVLQALETIDFKHSEVTVRINPIDSPWWQEDLQTILPANPDAIVLPKANREAIETMEQYLEVKGILESVKWLLLIESPMDVMHLKEICEASTRIEALCLGGEDYSSNLGVKRTKEGLEIQYARMAIATAAKAYGYDAIDTPFTDVDDEEGLLENMKLAKAIGMNGMLLIGPRQVETVNRFFSPSEHEIIEAKEILRLNETYKSQGLGVFSFKGKMVDAPVIARAEQTMVAAKRWGLAE